ncbi:beta-ketoacyl reductase [Acerihabitans sp. KWT182]|uniref:Beta-ketoacyl reductase n=1 Tax=Acerihabitans sp. KWT182 TaxID=3157919 RepID=A0AAU7Q4K3_9GAMM
MLWGLSRTLRLEHPEIPCRVIDIDPGDGDAMLSADALTALTRGLNGHSPRESVWRGNQCYVPSLASHEYAIRARQSAAVSPAAGFYLISGGFGAFGLHLAHWLIRRGINTLVLMGRSGAGDTARQAITGLEQLGARIGSYAVDVADPEALQRAVSHAEAAFGPLTGIIHGAGILRGGWLSHAGGAAHYETLRPKVVGAMNLHAITRQRPVAEFILISSASSVLGLSRYAGYAAANAYLDALAWMRRGAGLPALSIGFGPFSDAGMALSEPSLVNSTCLPALTMAEGIQWLSRALDAGAAHLIAMAYAAPQPADAASSTPVSSIAAPWRASQVMDFIRRQAADLAGCDGHRLSLRRPLRDAGIDSLTGVELRNRLQRHFSIPLPVTLLWDYPTLAELAAFIHERLQMTYSYGENCNE